MGKIIDLHIHTNKSDGGFSPFEIIDIAKKNNLNCISITDHDTIDAYSNELINYAKDNNIKLIPGVEISTKVNKCGIHVLGYNIDINNIEFRNQLLKIRNSRHDYLKNVSVALNRLGYFVNISELEKIDAVTKAHIALDVINNIDNKDLLIKNFNKIPSKGEFIENVMNEGCSAYVEKKSLTPKQAAELIRMANGKVVLAHPVAYTFEDNLSEDDILNIVNDMKADGLESNYIYVDRFDVKHDCTKQWNDFAVRNNLFTTVGSDFHNYDGLRPVIGLIGEDIHIDSLKVINNILD